MNRFYTRRNINIGLVVSLAVISFFAWYTYLNMQKARRETKTVNKTLQSLKVLEDLMDDMQDIETSHRGYLISGNKQFLQPYYSIIQKLKRDTVVLRELHLAYPHREKVFNDLIGFVNRNVETVRLTVDKTGTAVYDSAFRAVQAGRGREIMDSIRQALWSVENEDRLVLARSNADREKAATNTAKLFIALAGIFILILYILYRRITRELKYREEYEDRIAYMANLVEKTSDAIISTNTEGVIISWNKGAEKIYGYTQGEAVGKFSPEITGSGISKERAEEIRKEINRKGFVEMEVYHKNKAGEKIYCLASFSPLFDDNGVVSGYVSVIRDITQRMNSENLLRQFNIELAEKVKEKTAEIRQSEERYTSMISQASDGIFIMNEEGKYVDVNPAGCSLLGYSREELLQMSATDILPKGVLPMAVEKYEELKQGQIIVKDRKIARRDGALMFVETSYKMLSTGNIMAIARDITERRQSETRIKESEEKLRHILSSSADDFYVTDRNYRITLVNKMAEKNLEKAWGNPVTLGADVLKLVPPEKKDEIKKNFDKVFAGERVEYEVDNTNNEIRGWVQVSYMPVFDEKNRVTGAFVVSKNITVRKKAEDELKQSSNRFEMISRTTNDAVWEWDLKSGRLWSNDNHQFLYGLKPEDPVPTEEMWAQRIHPDDRQAVVDTQKRILASDKNVFISEYRFYTEKEGYRDLYDRCYIVRDKEGKPVRMMGSMMDITERKKAEQAIRANEETQRLIMNSALDAIVCINTEGNIIVWTPQAEKIFGWKEKDVTGKALADIIIPQQYREQHINGIRRYLETGEQKMLNKLVEVTALNQEGNEFPVELSITPVTQGGAQFFCAFIRDITQRQKAEFELRESEERYRTLVENAPEALVVMDMENGKFISVSESAAKLFKMSKEELLKIGPLEVSPEYQPDGRLSSEIALEKIGQAIAGGKPSFEWTHCDIDRNPITCEIWLVRLPSEKRTLIRGSIVDIGERKKAERKLLESETKYRAFFENSLDGILLTSMDGEVISANPSACAMFGMTEAEIIHVGRNGLVDLTDPKLENLLQERRVKGKATGELTLIRKNGSVFPAEVSSAYFIDAYGQERTSMIIRDITQRKVAEEEIKKINARFDIVSKATSDIVWDWNLPADSLWWNDNYYSNIGYKKKKEVVHIEEWFSRIHPEDVSRVRDKIQKTFAGESTVWRDEYRYTHADGTYLNFLDRGFIMRDKSGVAIRMIGSMVDMTPIYNAQREVAESENRLRTILDTDPECIKLMGPACQLYEINKAGLEMLEAENFEMIKGQSILSVVAESQQKAAAKLVKDAFKDQSGRMEFEMTTLKGKKRWCEINVVPFKDSQGKIIYALGVTLDISEKKKAEIELKQNEEKYRTLVEQAVDAIALYDEKGNILDVNSGASALLGYSKEELSNMSLNDILLEEEIIESPIRYDVLQTGSSTVKQRKMRRKNGTVVETEVRSQQLPDGRFLSVVRDMTERIRTEEELKTSYKAIRNLTAHLQNIREEERTNIAREIHDELGQQLTVLKMDVSWINKKIDGTTDDTIKEKMKELLAMLDDTVKTVRRISSELRPSLLDDLGLVAAMEWQLKEFEKRSGIKTKLASPEKEIKLSNAIKTALFRIFQESLTNVARHSQAKNISVTLEQKNNSFVLSIIDDGKGFDKEKIAEKRTLGILGMNERTKMIGGNYEIVSVPDKGTRVSVSVPVNDPV